MTIRSHTHLPNVGVILPAGGKGLRLGAAEPKQFLALQGSVLVGDEVKKTTGKVMLWYTLEAFHKLEFVKSIALVLPPDRIPEYALQLAAFPKVKLVEGGSERWESVRNGFQALGSDLAYVMVHDVARPFVSETIIRRCLSAVSPKACIIAAMPASDTIKQVSESSNGVPTEPSAQTGGCLVTATLDRRRLILVQTPQVFPREILSAVYAAPISGDLPTDEAQMVERAGYEVRWVKGGSCNRKVTEAEDLIWARWMAARLEAGESFSEEVNV